MSSILTPSGHFRALADACRRVSVVWPKVGAVWRIHALALASSSAPLAALRVAEEGLQICGEDLELVLLCARLHLNELSMVHVSWTS